MDAEDGMNPRDANARTPRPMLPSVDRVLRMPAVAAMAAEHGHAFVAAEVKRVLGALRQATVAGEAPGAPDPEAVATLVATGVAARAAPSLRPVFNLTGTVLHTNLGRALLPDAAAEAVATAARLAVNLEFDIDSGERGDRDSLVESLLCEITGAEAATVVNNNAAAVLLTITALAARREAVISRGELVEIGGSFRMPDVMRCAGAKMIEVGTTNRTHARDYADAINRRTGLILKVHTSNYVVRGFTATVGETELAAIAHQAGVAFAVDLGSGSLVDLSQYGLPREPMVQEAIRDGADVVTFSGDKLLGGPQAGLIVGRREVVARIRNHPLKRALRVSKLTLAALERTLALYRHPESLSRTLPTLRLLTRPLSEVRAVAQRIAGPLAAALEVAFEVSVDDMTSQIGSGAVPVDTIPSAGVLIRSRKAKATGRHLQALAAALRALPLPVIGRIADDTLILDTRMLEDEAAFVTQLSQLRRPE
jgi:L-seryl-tRNA(Ser) seleniumtransferase